MSRFASLDTLKKKEEKKESGNEYYAGGHDSKTGGGSGLAVEGNPDDQPEHIRKIIEQSRKQKPAGDIPPQGGVGAPVKVVLYKNGFIVDDGPFRDLTTEQNRKFVESLGQGYAPQELVDAAVGGSVNVALDNRGHEDYTPPPPPAYVAFGGTGSSLGSSVASSGSFVFTPQTMVQCPVPLINESSPTTTLQIRTHDGKKLRVKLNVSNTVAELLASIASQGGTPPGPFTMSHGYPVQQVSSVGQTLAEANLSGAAVTIKLV
jgi:UBX domain-containing protein 1